MAPFSYTNQYGVTYYLHYVCGTDGRTYYVMRRSAAGAAGQLPPGFEVHETVSGRVAVRRIRPPQLTTLERQLLRSAMEDLRPYAYLLDIDSKTATVYASAEDRQCFLKSLDAEFADGFAAALTKTLAPQYSLELVELFRARRKQQKARQPRYYPLLRFVLAARHPRRFAVERVCFSGEDSWIRLEILPLAAAVMKYLPHLGKDSFFDLI